jgi:hypothetical protein
MATTTNDKTAPSKRAPTQPLPPASPTDEAPGAEHALDGVPTSTGSGDSGTGRP